MDPVAAGLIGFALSFSSTVFAVKVLEEQGEMQTLHGRVAIGILVMQDIVAVVFIALSTGRLPSPWALLLFGLIPLRPLLFAIMDRCGHGELVPLFGLVAALVLGAETFELLGVKADLGALILGMLVAAHPRAGEISASLLGMKDILLVGFFLSIGMTATLSLHAFIVAAALVVFLPFKVVLFYFLLTRFRLRARSATLTSLSLATFSEFGLIVGHMGVTGGWLTADWLAVIAIALSATFILGAPLYRVADEIHTRYHALLRSWEGPERLPDDQPIHFGDARIAVLGMGRIGTGAYDELARRFGPALIGLDRDPDRVAAHLGVGRRVVSGDPSDPDFWERVRPGDIRLVLLTLPQINANLDVLRRLRDGPYDGRIAVVARFPDEVPKLQSAGAHMVVDSFTEAGAGFALEAERFFGGDLNDLAAIDRRAPGDAPSGSGS